MSRSITMSKGSTQISVDERRRAHYEQFGYKAAAPKAKPKPPTKQEHNVTKTFEGAPN